MPLNSQDFQELKTTIEDWIRAARDLAEQERKGTAPQQNQVQGPATAEGVGPRQNLAPAVLAAATNNLAPKADGASGFGLSALRQTLAAGGATGAASLVGGLAGGLPGLAVAGVSAVHDAVGAVIERPLAAARSGLAAYTASPTSDTESMAKFRFRRASELSELDSDEKSDHNLRGYVTYGTDGVAMRDLSRAQSRRQIAQQSDDELGPQESALELTRRQLGGFAAAGGMKEGPEGDAGRKLADHLYKFNLKLATSQQDFEKWARVRDQRLLSTSPGNASGMAGQ